jgi:hypothetical protein
MWAEELSVCTGRTLEPFEDNVPAAHRTTAFSLMVYQAWGISACLKECWAIWQDDIARRHDLVQVQQTTIEQAIIYAFCAMIRSPSRQCRPPDETCYAAVVLR